MTDEQLGILGDAFRHRRVYLGQVLAGAANKETQSKYWTAKVECIDGMMKDVDDEVNKRHPQSKPEFSWEKEHDYSSVDVHRV